MMTVYRRHPRIAIAFGLACAITLFFAGRLTNDVLYWHGHENEAVQPWMTVRYLARSWDVNPRAVDQIVGLSPAMDERLTLRDIAAHDKVPVEQLIQRVEGSIAELKAMNHRGGPP